MGRGRKGIEAAAIVAIGLVACGRGPSAQVGEAEAEAAESAASARSLQYELDALEARLHRGRAVVKLWEELGTRHQGISEVACKNAQLHAEGMAAADRKDKARLARRRLAHSMVPAVATDAQVTGYRTTAAPAAATSISAKGSKAGQ
ncbi:MAG: hypothetical protein HY901_10605 [Deltaproteobacteria bacterium]|nr:hypothetical protein [Deltaproteobacteria bacterium]